MTVPGVSYEFMDGEEGWTPVIKKRKTVHTRLHGRSER